MNLHNSYPGRAWIEVLWKRHKEESMIEDSCYCSGIFLPGNRRYSPREWRRALIDFIFGICSDKKIYREYPFIVFAGAGEAKNNITIFLSSEGGRVFEALRDNKAVDEIPKFSVNGLLAISNIESSVIVGLLRFAKNPNIKMLKIHLQGNKYFALWKHRQRSRLSFAGENIDPFVPDI